MYIPDISEGEARGRLRKLYHHIKATMRVPLVNDLFRALAFCPSFLHYAFEVSRPNLLSLSFERSADELRAFTISEPISLHLPPYVSGRDMRGAKMMLPVFHYVDVKLLLLVTAWCEALSERPISGQPHQADETFIPPGIPATFPKQVPMLRMEQATPDVRHLIQNIVDTHHTSGPASDILTLGCYPTFLAGVWQQIHPLVHTPWYQEHARRLLAHAQTLAHALPYPIPLPPERLQLLLGRREVTCSLGILSLFQHMLPSLILDIELMTRMLANADRQ